jgi:dUTP pyrophosphatase
MGIFEDMQAKVLLLADPNSGYTQEDFNKEFDVILAQPDPDMYKIPFEFANKSTNPDPDYATEGSSGFDLRANLDLPIMILSGDRAIVPTGLFFKIPENFEIQIRPRSGLAAKNGVTVLNTPGTIDADYRGEIKVILINHGVDRFIINHGDRIAQAVVAFVHSKKLVKMTKVDDIDTNTERSAGGFGSTGSK